MTVTETPSSACTPGKDLLQSTTRKRATPGAAAASSSVMRALSRQRLGRRHLPAEPLHDLALRGQLVARREAAAMDHGFDARGHVLADLSSVNGGAGPQRTHAPWCYYQF